MVAAAIKITKIAISQQRFTNSSRGRNGLEEANVLLYAPSPPFCVRYIPRSQRRVGVEVTRVFHQQWTGRLMKYVYTYTVYSGERHGG